MPEDIQDALDYILDEYGCTSESCECGEIVCLVDSEFVEAAKLVAEWVKENCK